MTQELVLVTGGSGFIAAHCIDQLLRAGYQVRTTVRSPAREAGVRGMLQVAGNEHPAALTFVVADLTADAGWAQAVEGCTYVLHVASPFPAKSPKDENELIVPAREGTLRVLRAARLAGVKRVVLTSSFVAIGYGHPPQTAPYDETSWTNLEGEGISAYAKSKTLAERAAWDFMQSEGQGLQLSVINPVGVFGPVLGPDYATSARIVTAFMDGEVPACPRFAFGVVDVRDVAALHLLAMTHPAANGERFLAVAGESMTVLAAAALLKARLGAAARRVPTRQLPDWLVRFAAHFITDLKLIVPELGKTKHATHAKATRMLGWVPRSNEEALLATAESLLRLKLLKHSA